jgi:hypothetical protein
MLFDGNNKQVNWTNYTAHNPSWEAENRQASRVIPSILYATKIHCPIDICKSNIMKFLVMNLFFFKDLLSIFRS